MRYVRVRFNVAIGRYLAGEMYDVEDNDAIRKLASNGLADIVPYPPRDSVTV